jgi:hypothetical protein
MPTRTAGAPWGRQHVVGDVQTKPDRLCRLGDAQQQGIPDRLDLGGAVGAQFGPHRGAEVGDQPRRLLVPVGLGQGGETGDVGEQEGRRCRGLLGVRRGTHRPAAATVVRQHADPGAI